jgi:hypothetical protein
MAPLAAGVGIGLSGCSTGTDKGPEAATAPAQAWDLEADVVVIGFGGAGAAASIEAANAGAQVLLLEKNAEKSHLCNTLMAGGIFHSPDKDGNPESLKKYLRAMFSGENLPTKTEPEQSPLFVDGIVEKFAALVTENLDFMKGLDPEYSVFESGGAAFPQFPGAEDCGYKAYYSGYGRNFTNPNFPTVNLPKEETGSGLAFFNCLRNGVQERSDRITLMLETPARKLIKSEDGETLITKDPSRYFSYKNAVKMDITTLTFPNDPSYMIFDEAKRLDGPLTNLTLSTAGFGLIPWDEKNETPIERGWILKADTIEELAMKISSSRASCRCPQEAQTALWQT